MIGSTEIRAPDIGKEIFIRLKSRKLIEKDRGAKFSNF